MSNRLSHPLLVLGCFAVAGCGASQTSQDSGPADATAIGQDAVADGGVDAFVEGGRDAANDSASDSSADAVSDAPSCVNDQAPNTNVVKGPQSTSPPTDNDSTFNGTSIDPTNANRVLIGSERNGMVLTEDGGGTFVRRRQGIRNWNEPVQGDYYPEAWSSVISPFASSTMWIAMADSPGPVNGNYPSAMAGLYRSTDNGLTWLRSNCGLTNSKTAAVVYVGDSALNMVAGVGAGNTSIPNVTPTYWNGGLYLSKDGGTNWTQTYAITQGRVEFRKIVVRGTGASRVLITLGVGVEGSPSTGFLRSTDGGASWAKLPVALETAFITNFDVSADGQTIYALNGDEFQDVKFHRSINQGTSWTDVKPNIGTGPINSRVTVAISPTDTNRFIFSVTSPNDIYMSTDGGLTASKVMSALTGQRRIGWIGFAPSNSNRAYALSTDGAEFVRSDDAGATWASKAVLRTTVFNQP